MKFVLILGVQGGGVARKVELKVSMTSVSFPSDSSSDILEFICCGTFSWSLDSALWSPRGYISLTVWTETAGKQLECGRGNRTFVCFDTSQSLESAEFSLFKCHYFSQNGSIGLVVLCVLLEPAGLLADIVASMYVILLKLATNVSVVFKGEAGLLQTCFLTCVLFKSNFIFLFLILLEPQEW